MTKADIHPRFLRRLSIYLRRPMAALPKRCMRSDELLAASRRVDGLQIASCDIVQLVTTRPIAI